MSRLLAIFVVGLAAVSLLGCATFPGQTAKSSNDSVGAPPSHFFRSTGESTGVDPIARDIEKNLGYR